MRISLIVKSLVTWLFYFIQSLLQKGKINKALQNCLCLYIHPGTGYIYIKLLQFNTFLLPCSRRFWIICLFPQFCGFKKPSVWVANTQQIAGTCSPTAAKQAGLWTPCVYCSATVSSITYHFLALAPTFCWKTFQIPSFCHDCGLSIALILGLPDLTNKNTNKNPVKFEFQITSDIFSVSISYLLNLCQKKIIVHPKCKLKRESCIESNNPTSFSVICGVWPSGLWASLKLSSFGLYHICCFPLFCCFCLVQWLL